MLRHGREFCFTLGLSLLGATAACANDVADFYKGKRLTIVIGYDPGGGYDLYARVIGKHIVHHIPGNPEFVPQNMPGAGSRKAANWLYELAPHDGTVIATINNSAALDQALGEPSVKYDAIKFNWIGNPIVDAGVTLTMAKGPYRTIEDVATKGGMICGGTGAASPSVIYPRIINEFVGGNVKVVGGYTTTTELALAMRRDEISCIAGNTWTSLGTALAELFTSKSMTIVLHWGQNANPAIDAYVGHHVPSIFDYVKTAGDRKVMDLLLSSAAIGRPLLAPPNVPTDRVASLRQAFDQTMKDPDFISDVHKANLDLDPLSGERLQELIASFANVSTETQARARDLMRPPQEYTEHR